ncbi:MAG TPA: ATP-binding protein, partial [Polyangiaceae bacterium LLY-WYZ-15_(1-7)]|nr:ATP-binding protein [Polyangiaceae bacterium LLY-WYZ-15_(1-7)]
PSVLDEVGLGDALARLCDDLGETSGLDVRLEAPAELDLAPALETATYRVAQEALHNAQRHADAERIELRLALGERLRLEVRDDGVGFDPAAVEEGGHGLRGMRERAELLGGSLEIASAPGEGTAILLELPIEETP